MGFESPSFEKKEQGESVADKLKEEALDLAHIGLIGTRETSGNEIPKMRPETWNENDGVIVFSDKGSRVYAIPASEWARDLLMHDKDGAMKKDENVGVPHLNNAEVWGDEARREGMNSFREWQKLAEKRLRPMPKE
ncbi:MAG: hypothetical protein AAB975_01210 [Patescibacteria group bacterium]